MTISMFNLSDGSLIQVAGDGRDSEGRVRYLFDIRASDGRRLALIDDIRSGVGAIESNFDAMAILSSFLGAWVESFGYSGSDNRDMFDVDNESFRDWAEMNADELACEFVDWS